MDDSQEQGGVLWGVARDPRNNKTKLGRWNASSFLPTMAEINNQPSEQQNAGQAEPEQLQQNGTIGTKPSKATVVSLNC